MKQENGLRKREAKGRGKKAEKMAATKKDTGLKKIHTQEASVKLTNENKKGKGRLP